MGVIIDEVQGEVEPVDPSPTQPDEPEGAGRDPATQTRRILATVQRRAWLDARLSDE